MLQEWNDQLALTEAAERTLGLDVSAGGGGAAAAAAAPLFGLDHRAEYLAR